jgi:protein-S-isoprenylcysteine O-methyltransferase Ste14
MTRTLRFILGYLLGITLFLLIIPYGFFQLSKLDYLVNYKMLIGSMTLRYIVSACILFLGAVFAIWSNLFLFLVGKGGPAEGFGIAVSPRTQKLVTRGPYRYCRHPMVFGAFCIYLSLVLFLNSVLGLLGILVLLFLAGIYLRYSEEKRLLNNFGDEYLEYRKKVSMIIPYKPFKTATPLNPNET